MIAIIGKGAWGRALAHALGHTKTQVIFFGRNDDPKGLEFVEGIIFAVPAQETRHVFEKYKNFIKSPVLLTAKGIEQKTHQLQSGITEEFLNSPYSILSGPTFAEEVLENKPTACVVASLNSTQGVFWGKYFNSSLFRVYFQDDIIGVQLGGALKNVMAIASGMLSGLDAGENARSALLTRALVEMIRFGKALGARSETFIGLSGLGDLMLTATSKKSRNYAFGLSLTETRISLDHFLREGVLTTSVVCEIAKVKNISMPIAETVYEILFYGKDPKIAFEDLMLRPLKDEAIF